MENYRLKPKIMFEKEHLKTKNKSIVKRFGKQFCFYF